MHPDARNQAMRHYCAAHQATPGSPTYHLEIQLADLWADIAQTLAPRKDA